MPEDDIMGELEELSQMVEGEEDIEKGLQEIEKITSEVESESKKGKSAATAGAAATKKSAEKKKAEQKEEDKKSEEKKEQKSEQKQPEESEDKKPAKPVQAPEKVIKQGNGFKIASALLILVGFAIYALAFYLRWNGWHLISYPPSSVVALGGTLMILAGGEVYYRGKER